jgi:hypothetical protein
VISPFVFVGRAGEATPTVVIFVIKPGTSRIEEKPREGIGRRVKEKSNTGKQKTVADTVKLPPFQKRWMIHLQHSTGLVGQTDDSYSKAV